MDHYTERSAPPCTPDFTTQFDLSIRFLPLYPHPEPVHYLAGQLPRKRAPPPYSAYARAEEYRYFNRALRLRSSLTLPDILEEDVADVEIEESFMTARLSSATQTMALAKKKDVSAKFLGFVAMLRGKCSRIATRIRVVANVGSNFNSDSLAEA